MKAENISAYKIIEQHRIEDVNSMGYLLEHKKSGARVTVLENDDDNKVFYIGFRTPPKDSTGVAHILEHSTLCGSKEFLLKDPFVELVKGSLNTFLNAMTYPDKTVYPVASCNDQDFKNLMHVYLDAVFYPNIYQERKIFEQEGWHYELNDIKDDLNINGVVYNEMKGAFSAPDDVMDREIFNSLYPDTAYGVESGGAPEAIPDLTYEDFLAFHQKYYHPINSYIYLYGNADMEERLNWMDEHYLSAYDRISVESMPGTQNGYHEVKRIERHFPITEEENEEDNTYLSYNAVIGTSLDRNLYLAFQVIDYAIAGAAGTPLKQALFDAGIGTEVVSVYENGIYQPYYSIVVKNANADDEERFVEIIERELTRVVKNGFDKNALLAGLNALEFKHREADFGATPKGLIYGLNALDSWLYDKDLPFLHMEANETFAGLKALIDSDYFEQLVDRYLLKNTHKTILTLKPMRGLTAKREKELSNKLAAYKASLTQEELKAIVDATKALKDYQEAEESKEALTCLPRLQRTDIRKEVIPFINQQVKIDGADGLHHDVFTNGILYLSLLFDMKKVPVGLYPYIGLLKAVLGYVDTSSYSYEQLGYEINKRTGTLFATTKIMPQNGETNQFSMFFEMAMSVLTPQLKSGIELLDEIMFTSKLTDAKRLKEIIGESKSRLQASMTSSGNAVAMGRALSYASVYGATTDRIGGLEYFRFLENAEANFEVKKNEIIQGLKDVCSYIFRKENLLVDVTGKKEQLEALQGCIAPLLLKMNTKTIDSTVLDETITLQKRNEGFTTSGQVLFVCRAGNYKKNGIRYTGSLRILKTIMGYDYLWNEVRVKGGAYGCMSNYMRNGEAYFVSYRDPNLKNTIEVFEHAVDYLAAFEADEEVMTKYIIGTISDLDIPLTPRTAGVRSLAAWISGIRQDEIQQERDEILNASQESIRQLAEYVKAFLADEIVCVVGNEEKIRNEKELFGMVTPLIH